MPVRDGTEGGLLGKLELPHCRLKLGEMDGGPLDFWNHWKTQILVLLSLALQLALLLLAGIRRREASPILRILLWQAYQLADSIAIYVVGHLSVSQEHQLMAFWAPFLLLHLGGPDNIAAYAIEDSKLWLRHLQNLAVQVLGVAYILYKHLAGDDRYLRLATILVFSVGVVKYVERTLALRCANLDSLRRSLEKELAKRHQGSLVKAREDDDEVLVRNAHSMFHVCKHAIFDSWVDKDSAKMLKDLTSNKSYDDIWSFMEVELSLMYDILYTKAGVIHTWSGYCIRVLSPMAAAASLLLFLFSADDGHGTIDIAVTYILLAGAILLETASLLNALGSSWTYAFLCATRWNWLRSAARRNGRWYRLRCFVKTITGRGGKYKISARRWSGKMGQFNLLHCCSRRKSSKLPLLGLFARKLGYEDWWIGYHYSGTIDIPNYLKKNLHGYVSTLPKKERSLNAQGVLRKNWGQQALEIYDKDVYKKFKDKKLLGVEFQEGIIIWHIGTDVLLAKSTGAASDDEDIRTMVEQIRMLSNYMMFLLVKHTYMLPGLAQSSLYRLCTKNLEGIYESNARNCSIKNLYTGFKQLFRWHDGPNFAGSTGIDRSVNNNKQKTGRDKLANILFRKNPEYSDDMPRLWYANEVTKILLLEEEKKGSWGTLRLLLDVWIDFLVYASNRCSRESHAKKLSNGGELTTILWLMTNYLHQVDYAVERDHASTTA